MSLASGRDGALQPIRPQQPKDKPYTITITEQGFGLPFIFSCFKTFANQI
jgi:hypothetical protein